MIRYALQLILAFIFLACFFSWVNAAEPDESGIGGTGHRPQQAIDPEDLEQIEIPERLELPADIELLDAFDQFNSGAAEMNESVEDTAPPPEK